jgi:hypothetical protein
VGGRSISRFAEYTVMIQFLNDIAQNLFQLLRLLESKT